MFDTIAGLPLHPLVVHAAVILSPVSALLLILVVAFSKLRARYATLAVVAVLVGTLAVIVARFSGEALEKRVGDPGQHAQFGNLAMLWSIVFAILAILWWGLLRRPGAAAATVTGVIAALAAVVMIGLVVLAGHSGAERVWGGIVAATNDTGRSSGGSQSASSSTSTSGTSSPAPDSSTASAADIDYTLSQVAEHNQRSDCWAAIEGSVYDLTSWIDQHPGGADRILALCGTDATSAFEAQHGGQGRPESELATLKIGSLS